MAIFLWHRPIITDFISLAMSLLRNSSLSVYNDLLAGILGNETACLPVVRFLASCHDMAQWNAPGVDFPGKFRR
jgi:hypothetical protein